MPKILAPGDLKGAGQLSFRDEMMNLNNGYASFEWLGVATVVPGVLAAALDIVRYSPQRAVVNGTWANNTAFIIPANSLITRVGFKTVDALTLGAATGKLKLASSLTANTASLFVSSAAASSNTLAAGLAQGTAALAGVTVGGSDVTYKIFATDGNATEGSAAASTVTTTLTDKLIYVRVCGYYPLPFPDNSEFTVAPPLSTSDNYVG
jgi:hypothetical protein